MAFQIINLLLSVGQVFSGSLKDYRSWNRSRKEKVATLFDNVANCLIEIASSLREGQQPVLGCAELAVYLEEFEEVVGGSLNEEKTKVLKEFIKQKYGYWSEIPWAQIEFGLIDKNTSKGDLERRARRVDEVIGIFRANANLLRAKA
jgi:hypothetical protein